MYGAAKGPQATLKVYNVGGPLSNRRRPTKWRDAVKTYTPETIATSHIQLSSDLQELVERLAGNNHDHWAQKRIAEGWHYGTKRNDTEKEHPDLVPYDRLPESEKEYDRKTVVEALKAIIALGYEIKRAHLKGSTA